MRCSVLWLSLLRRLSLIQDAAHVCARQPLEPVRPSPVNVVASHRQRCGNITTAPSLGAYSALADFPSVATSDDRSCGVEVIAAGGSPRAHRH